MHFLGLTYLHWCRHGCRFFDNNNNNDNHFSCTTTTSANSKEKVLGTVVGGERMSKWESNEKARKKDSKKEKAMTDCANKPAKTKSEQVCTWTREEGRKKQNFFLEKTIFLLPNNWNKVEKRRRGGEDEETVDRSSSILLTHTVKCSFTILIRLRTAQNTHFNLTKLILGHSVLDWI